MFRGLMAEPPIRNSDAGFGVAQTLEMAGCGGRRPVSGQVFLRKNYRGSARPSRAGPRGPPELHDLGEADQRTLELDDPEIMSSPRQRWRAASRPRRPRPGRAATG